MDMPQITDQRTYPPGVPSWIDVATPDAAASCDFYGGLFGWTFEDMVPAEAPGSYLVGRLNGHDVAAVRPEAGGEDRGWMSYVATDDVDALARRVKDAGGSVLDPPEDVGRAGRGATFADPEGARSAAGTPERGLARSWSMFPVRGTSAFSTPPNHVIRSSSTSVSSDGEWMPTSALE